MKTRASTTQSTAPTPMPRIWYQNWTRRSVPRRQPVERSCCMSTPTELQMISTVAAVIATMGLRRPMADIRSTETTNALEMGFWSVMPVEMPLTNTKRTLSPSPKRM